MFPRSSSPSSSSTAPTADIPPTTWLSANSNGTDGTMFPGGAGGGGGSGQQQLAISNGVLLAAVIFLFMVVVFVFLLYLYAKRYLGANPLLATHGSASSRFLFVAASPLPQRGLPASVLNSLPVTVYAGSPAPGSGSPKDKDKDGLECAVCLSEVADGEKVRTLPKCGHGFHVECIDMWFHSHDTCPLCRAPVGAAADLDTLPREEPSGASLEFPVFPTNVLFWGTHDEVTNAGLPTPPPPPIANAASASASSSASARSSRKENQHQLVIDIPTRGPVALHTPPTNSPLPASRMPGDDMRSPVSARLRSLRRLLSRGKQAVVGASSSSYSPSPRAGAAGDIEQGLAAGAESARPPKTPKTPKTPPSSAN